MDARFIYLIVFACLLFFVVWLQKKFCVICDASTARPKPYSYARLQLVWWTFIVFASFITILIASGTIPTLDSSTLILLGIGALTSASSRIVDISDAANLPGNSSNNNPATAQQPPVNANPPVADPDPAQPVPVAPVVSTPVVAAAPAATPVLSRDMPSQGFWLDVLSDKNGISIHRLQALIFNLLFGIWFIYQTVTHLKGVGPATSLAVLSSIIPVISQNNLILLGLSAGTYVALKSLENK